MRRKLLFVDQGIAFGGSLVVLANLIAHLDLDRYSITLITAMPEAARKHLFAPAVRVLYRKPILDYGRRQSAVSWLRRFGKPAARLGGYVFSLTSVVTDGLFKLDLRRLLRRERPDLVHITNCDMTTEVCAELDQTFVLHFHGTASAQPTARWRWAVGKASSLIAVSEYIAAKVRALGLPGPALQVIHNPADQPAQLAPQAISELRSRWKLPADAIVIGIFGRLVEWKGQIEFLRAFAAAKARYPNIAALIVGDGSEFGGGYERRLRQLVTERELSSDVAFTGYSSDVGSLYQICDIVVHASIEPEPFGLVIIEAMVAGAAVIASSLGAGPEIVEHGENGLLADPRDHDQLTQALNTFLADPELRGRLARRGKEMAWSRFAPATYAEKIQKVYDEVLD